MSNRPNSAPLNVYASDSSIWSITGVCNSVSLVIPPETDNMGKPDMAEYERRLNAVERKVELLEKIMMKLPSWALKGVGKE